MFIVTKPLHNNFGLAFPINTIVKLTHGPDIRTFLLRSNTATRCIDHVLLHNWLKDGTLVANESF